MKLPRIPRHVVARPSASPSSDFAIPLAIDDALGAVLLHARGLGREILARIMRERAGVGISSAELEPELQQAAFEFGKMGLPPVIAGLCLREVREAAEAAIERERAIQ